MRRFEQVQGVRTRSDFAVAIAIYLPRRRIICPLHEQPHVLGDPLAPVYVAERFERSGATLAVVPGTQGRQDVDYGLRRQSRHRRAAAVLVFVYPPPIRLDDP